jgi:hypothetical protein
LKKKEDSIEIGINYENQKTTHLTQELQQLLNNNKNDCIQTFLQGLTPTESTDYSLWKATKKIKQGKKPTAPLRTSQGTWARKNVEKAHAFAEHFGKVFQPHPSGNEPEDEALTQLLETLYQLKPPINCLKRAEVQDIINSLNSKKSSGYNLITGKILKELPIIEIKYLTQTFSAVLLTGYFPAQWKVAQILILQPGKPPTELTSYCLISLLLIVSKVFEKLLLKRLLPIFEINRLIPNHQFGFRQRHSTIQQTHRVVRKINEALENKQCCSAAFLDISQAFNKVWHTGLLYKLRQSLPLNYFLILNPLT